MKTQTVFLIAAITICFSSCKKSNDKNNDLKSLFNNTTWTGELQYTGRPIPENFAIRFDPSGAFTWYEIDGDSTGTYTINNDSKTITIKFSGGITFTAAITDNKKLTGFFNGTGVPWAAINRLELDNSAVITEQELTGTVWKGFVTSPVQSITLNFKPSEKMDYTEAIGTQANVAYQLKHNVIRFNAVSNIRKYFGIIKNGEINGVHKLSTTGDYSNWKVGKQ